MCGLILTRETPVNFYPVNFYPVNFYVVYSQLAYIVSCLDAESRSQQQYRVNEYYVIIGSVSIKNPFIDVTRI